MVVEKGERSAALPPAGTAQRQAPGLRGTVARGVAWTGAMQAASALLGFLAFLVLARLLAPADFGVVALAAVVVGFGQLFVDQGLGSALVQRPTVQEGHLDSAFWASAAAGAALAVATFLLAPVAAEAARRPEFVPVLRWMAPMFLLGGLGATHGALARRAMVFGRLAGWGVAGSLAGGVVGVGMAMAGFGAVALAVQLVASVAVSTLGVWVLVPWRPGVAVSWRSLRELWPYGTSVLGAGVVGYVQARIDRVLVAGLLGVVALGYYAVAFRFVETLLNALTNLASHVLMPALSRLQAERIRFRAAFLEATRFTAMVAAPAFLGLAALAPQVLAVLVGPSWTPGAVALRWLAAWGLLAAVAHVATLALNALGRPSWNLGFAAVAFAIGVPALFLAAPWGIAAVAAVIFVRASLFVPIRYFVLRRLAGLTLRPYVGSVAASVGAATVMAAGIVLVAWAVGIPPDAVAVATAVAAGGCVYAVLLWLLDPQLLAHARTTARLAFARRVPAIEPGGPSP